MSVERIEMADEAEEIAAAMALRAARTTDELVSIWWRECEHFAGPARDRLREEYTTKLHMFAPMQRAG